MGVIMNILLSAFAGAFVGALMNFFINATTSHSTNPIDDDNIASTDNDVALIFNATNGNIEEVELLLKQGANVSAFNDEALQMSAKNGHTAIVIILLEHGANLHACNDYALRWGARNGHREIVDALLERGANVRLCDNEALRWSAERGHMEVVKALVKYGAKTRPYIGKALRWGAERGNIEIVQALLKYGIETQAFVNGIGAGVGTNAGVGAYAGVGAEIFNGGALWWSALKGYTEIVNALLTCQVTWYDQNAALQPAADNDHLETVRALLKHGINANADYALENACTSGNLCMVKELLKHGARSRGTNYASLLSSIHHKHYDVTKLLLESDASLYYEDNKILVDLQNKFDERVADLIFPYCCEEDYKYFPRAYLDAKSTQTKNARNI